MYYNKQGEEATEDTENTDHDVSAVASSLEVNPSNQADDADNLLDIMDQILERTVNDGAPTHNHAMDIDDDGYDHERDATVIFLKYLKWQRKRCLIYRKNL